MKIGFSTANYFPELSTEDAISHYGDLGVEILEVFLNTYSEMTPDYMDLLNQRLQARGVRVQSVHVMSMFMEPCLFDRLERRRQDFLDLFENTLDCLVSLGCNVHTFHGPPKNMVVQAGMAHIAACYDDLVRRARAKGVRIAQENVAYLASGELTFLQELRAAMREPLHYTFDIKQAVRSGLSPMEVVEVMGDKIINLHINDHDEAGTCLLPGRGRFDYEKLFSKLKELNYQGGAIIELYRENFADGAELMATRQRLIEIAGRAGLV